MLWALKYLADNPEAQSALRAALESKHVLALSEKRSPSAEEITRTTVPYLDAVIEETLRLSSTASLMSRETEVETEILGYRIPKNTNVMMPQQGPSFWEPGFAVDEKLRSPSSQAAAKDSGPREWEPEGMASFNPARWLTQLSDGTVEFDPLAGPILAFGQGIRGCYGRRLAYLSMRILFTLLVWNLEFLGCPEELSSYDAADGLTRSAQQTYVRLRRVRG